VTDADAERLHCALNAVILAARDIERGCDCEYDHRCGRCQRVVTLKVKLADLDAIQEPILRDQVRKLLTGGGAA
jgi:hypothetical protein